MNICAPDREPEREGPEEISDAALYRHLIVNHVGLRDHYAAAALTGLIGDARTFALIQQAKDGDDTAADFTASLAFELADAMMAARDRK